MFCLRRFVVAATGRAGVECPPFDVLRGYKFGIQKRRYFDTVLVSAAVGECQFSNAAVWRGFMPLHLYKHGATTTSLITTNPTRAQIAVLPRPWPQPFLTLSLSLT